MTQETQTELTQEQRRSLERVAYYLSIPYESRSDKAIAQDIANHRAFDGQDMTVERVLADIKSHCFEDDEDFDDEVVTNLRGEDLEAVL